MWNEPSGASGNYLPVCRLGRRTYASTRAARPRATAARRLRACAADTARRGASAAPPSFSRRRLRPGSSGRSLSARKAIVAPPAAANPWWQDLGRRASDRCASAAERRSVSRARPLLLTVKAASARGGPRGERLALSPAAKAGAADMIRQSALSGSITLRWEPGPANLPAAPCGAGWLFAG
jgi:hypothetical protein